MVEITPVEVQRRFDRLVEIFGDIVSRAGAQASTRCPYRDRDDRCTARFRCRNQRPIGAGAGTDERATTTQIAAGSLPTEDGAAVLSCSHDGTFDYRSAWESDPRAAGEARRRIRTIRGGAARRRQDA